MVLGDVHYLGASGCRFTHVGGDQITLVFNNPNNINIFQSPANSGQTLFHLRNIDIDLPETASSSDGIPSSHSGKCSEWFQVAKADGSYDDAKRTHSEVVTDEKIISPTIEEDSSDDLPVLIPTNASDIAPSAQPNHSLGLEMPLQNHEPVEYLSGEDTTAEGRGTPFPLAIDTRNLPSFPGSSSLSNSADVDYQNKEQLTTKGDGSPFPPPTNNSNVSSPTCSYFSVPETPSQDVRNPTEPVVPEANTASSSRLYSREPTSGLPNMVVFGGSFTGKSSVVNMLAREQVSEVDDGAAGTTLQHQGYTLKFDETLINIYDTAGLNEADKGGVPAKDALQQLLNLLRSVGGVNLVVFVTRPRIENHTVDNYNFLRQIFGDETVPIVLAITHREGGDNEKWWSKNKIEFHKQMGFDDHAIGTAKWELSSDPTYAELRASLHRVIHSHVVQGKRYLLPEPDVYRHRFENAFIRVYERLCRLFSTNKGELLWVYKEILRNDGMAEEHAMENVQRVRKELASKNAKKRRMIQH